MIRKALVIDDSRTTRAIIGRILRSMGFCVLEAENGKVALEVLSDNPDTQLALVDWNMPIMDGIDFVIAARGSSQHKHTHLVMVTTETEMEQMSKALAAGADEYIMKPFTDEVLREKLLLLGYETNEEATA